MRVAKRGGDLAGNRSSGADDFDLGGKDGECQSKDNISKNIHDACINPKHFSIPVDAAPLPTAH